MSLCLRQDGLNADGGWNPELLGATSFSVWLWLSIPQHQVPWQASSILRYQSATGVAVGNREVALGMGKARKMGLEKEMYFLFLSF